MVAGGAHHRRDDAGRQYFLRHGTGRELQEIRRNGCRNGGWPAAGRDIREQGGPVHCLSCGGALGTIERGDTDNFAYQLLRELRGPAEPAFSRYSSWNEAQARRQFANPSRGCGSFQRRRISHPRIQSLRKSPAHRGTHRRGDPRPCNPGKHTAAKSPWMHRRIQDDRLTKRLHFFSREAHMIEMCGKHDRRKRNQHW